MSAQSQVTSHCDVAHCGRENCITFFPFSCEAYFLFSIMTLWPSVSPYKLANASSLCNVIRFKRLMNISLASLFLLTYLNWKKAIIRLLMWVTLRLIQAISCLKTLSNTSYKLLILRCKLCLFVLSEISVLFIVVSMKEIFWFCGYHWLLQLKILGFLFLITLRDAGVNYFTSR